MANETGISWGAKTHRAVIFDLNQTTGLINIPSQAAATPYVGKELYYPRVYSLNVAEAQLVTNPGQGRVTDVMYFPPTDPDRASLTVGREQHDVIELLTGVKQIFEGERSMIHRATDKRGSERTVAMLLQQRAHSFPAGLPRWRCYTIPRATVVPNDSSYDDNATEITYNIVMSACRVTFWGLALSEVTHGCLESGYASWEAVGQHNFCAWLADGYEDVFNFPSDFLPGDATKTKVYDMSDGSAITGTVAGDFSTFTPTVQPDADTLMIASYEKAS